MSDVQLACFPAAYETAESTTSASRVFVLKPCATKLLILVIDSQIEFLDLLGEIDSC